MQTASERVQPGPDLRAGGAGRGHGALGVLSGDTAARRRGGRPGLGLRRSTRSGEIVTNAHVVSQGEGADLTEADQVYVEFADRNRVAADVLGVDPFADVALLKIDPDGLDLVPLQLGDDADLRVGDPVAAIGSPFGEQQSLSIGIVSAKERSVKSLTQFQIENSIQTDAAINPGNSGGPLLDADANVVGINQQIETQSNANAGVGFAVPISAIKRSIDQLREDGEVEYAYIGVSSQALYPQLAERLGLDTDYGGLIARVVSGGPADEAGLRGSRRPDPLPGTLGADRWRRDPRGRRQEGDRAPATSRDSSRNTSPATR